MGERTCEGCRWFQKFTSQTIGECRRHPPQHPQTQRGWLMVERGEFCGEWADKNTTPEQAERRELVRQFALAIVQGVYADPRDVSIRPETAAAQAQTFAIAMQEFLQEGQQ